MPGVDLIILSYGSSSDLIRMTQDAVNSAFHGLNSEEIQINILVMESNVNLKPFLYENAKTIYLEKKFNYNKFVNHALKMTNQEIVCIANNDLVFYSGWASEMLKVLLNEPDNIQSVSPFCGKYHPTIGIYENSGLYLGYEIRKEMAGWCFMFKRNLINIIGYFDERIKFWFSDNDYANLLKKNNIKHALVTSARVDHLGGVSTDKLSGQDKYDFTYGAYIYYDYKWNHRNKTKFLKDTIIHKARILKMKLLRKC